MKLLSYLCLFALLATFAVGQQSSVELVNPNAPAKTANSALLPAVFAGWQKAKAQASQDPAQVDPANAAVLKEYGYTDSEQATYTRDGRTIQVRAARFADAGGAYGAFTFYKRPEMLVQKIGDQAASASELVLFYRTSVLVQAHLDQLTAMSAADLRELAAALPRASGAAANLPVLPQYLPHQSYIKNSAKYVMGPQALAQISSPVPAQFVDFARGGELALGKYTTDRGTADLVLISYPTPQIAGDHLRAIEAAIQQERSNGEAMTGAMRMARRTGPMLVVAAGEISDADARALLESVNYDANVTWSEPTYTGKKNNIGNLVVAALALAGIVLVISLAAGLAYGGVRVLVKRFLPDRVFDRSADVDIIRLRLADESPQVLPTADLAAREITFVESRSNGHERRT
jgi:hypothetical protein